MIEELRNFLMTCPLLKVSETEAKIRVDYLDESPVSYEIQIMPTSPWVRKYVDGGGIKQLEFAFRCMNDFDGRDVTTNTKNIAFFDDFGKWLERTKPNIQDWIKVEALTAGYLFEQSSGLDKAIYQIQCRVLYVYYNI